MGSGRHNNHSPGRHPRTRVYQWVDASGVIWLAAGTLLRPPIQPAGTVASYDGIPFTPLTMAAARAVCRTMAGMLQARGVTVIDMTFRAPHRRGANGRFLPSKLVQSDTPLRPLECDLAAPPLTAP
jgi:hypothetical protein